MHSRLAKFCFYIEETEVKKYLKYLEYIEEFLSYV